MRVLSGRTTVVDNNLLISASCIQTFSKTIIHLLILNAGAELHRTTREWALVGPLRGLLGSRPRELRPVARSAMRAQPNSAALKNASVFGAPELRPSASVVRKQLGAGERPHSNHPSSQPAG